MRTLYRPLLYSLLVGASLLATSCGDKKTDPIAQPPATTATLSGQVTPAGSILSVTATDASGKASVATPTSGTGAYSFPSLALGTYTLVFAPASGYVAPTSAATTLVAGGTTVPTVAVALVPTTATLSGQIDPAGAVASVRATNEASGTVYTVTPTSTGAYSFPNLPFGRYTVLFIAASGFNATISTVSTTVVAGGTTLPLLTVTRLPRQASYRLNGATVTPVYISPQVLGNDRFITFETSANQRLTLFLQGLTPTVGTFSLNTATDYAQYNGADFVNYRSNFGSSASGTLTITAVNATARIYSGNFSFVGGVVNPNAGSPTTRTITNGTFVNISY
jgi:hypothetical protein